MFQVNFESLLPVDHFNQIIVDFKFHFSLSTVNCLNGQPFSFFNIVNLSMH